MTDAPPHARYAELHVYSNFTFLEGGSHPEELVERAVALGLDAIALTDRDGLYGAVRFATYARERGIAAIIGSELTFSDGARLVLLVENECGYANLCELISTAQLRGCKGDARLELADFAHRTEGLIALSGGVHGRIERALAGSDRNVVDCEAAALHALFGERFFLELQQHLTETDSVRNGALLDLAQRHGIACVATNGVVYAEKQDALLADVLCCIQHTTDLVQAREEHRLRPNAEYYLKSPLAMERLFANYAQAIGTSVSIAQRCSFRLERLTGQFPLFPVPAGNSAQRYLRELVAQGALARYGAPLALNVERQLEYELASLQSLIWPDTS